MHTYTHDPFIMRVCWSACSSASGRPRFTPVQVLINPAANAILLRLDEQLQNTRLRRESYRVWSRLTSAITVGLEVRAPAR